MTESGVVAAEATTPTQANQEAWDGEKTLRWFASYEGWSDRGEQIAIEAIAREMAGKRILDIGVGAGRTLPLLRAISNDYVAIDFMSQMVDLCGSKYPDARIELGDARDLSAFEDDSFDLIVFSWNGIDAVSHEDRPLILHEVRRVLAAGGVFLFSTHNEAGRGCGEKPWTVVPRDFLHPRHIAKLIVGFPRNMRNYRRYRPLGSIGDGWSVRNAAAHHFGLVIHYTTLEQEVTELAEAGFTDLEFRDNELGAVLQPHDDTSGAWWFQITARQSGAA
jgi:ubiquinone/menaquinone biosynthesis C-methylase UbiE